MIFFLYGEDTWRKQQKLQQIIDKFVRDVDPTRLNVQVFDASVTDQEVLRAALRTPPLFARRRMVILHHFLLTSKKVHHEVLRETLPLLGEDHIVIVSEDEEKPKTWKNKEAQAVWEYLEEHARSEAFKQLWGKPLEAAIMAQAKERGLTVEKEAAALLAVMSGGDLGYTEQECEKLLHYCNGRVATPEDIKLLCAAEGEANIFEFLDALGNKDQKTLLYTAEEQLREGDTLYLISRATGHVRSLLAIMLAGQAGAQALKLHPFVAKKVSAQARKWKVDELKRFLFALLTLEYKAKRGWAADPKTQLTALLTQFSSPAKASPP